MPALYLIEIPPQRHGEPEYRDRGGPRAGRFPDRQADSGYWQTDQPLNRWCLIQSYLASVRNHGPTVLDAITSALACDIGVYLQYARARVHSILAILPPETTEDTAVDASLPLHPATRVQTCRLTCTYGNFGSYRMRQPAMMLGVKG
ncbi:MAG: hypothetical protein JXA67_17860 [Micromonosporaceae bacterium]|nr:hypothetical protein [Micromonosporaceae bacterium]